MAIDLKSELISLTTNDDVKGHNTNETTTKEKLGMVSSPTAFEVAEFKTSDEESWSL